MLDKKKQIDYYIQALFVYGPIAQLVRAPACHAGGRRFEPVLGRHMPWQLSRQSSRLKICLSVVRFRPKAPFMRQQLSWQSATLPRWMSRVRVPSTAPFCWCHSQVVRRRSAKPLFSSSNLDGTSQRGLQSHCRPLYIFILGCLFAFQCGNGYDKINKNSI